MLTSELLEMKFLRLTPRKSKQSSRCEIDHEDDRMSSNAATSLSLGCGQFTLEGMVETFVPSPCKHKEASDSEMSSTRAPPSVAATDDLDSYGSDVDNLEQPEHDVIEQKIDRPKVLFKRQTSSFLRVADLNIECVSSSGTKSCNLDDSYPNFHHLSSEPPPGLPLDSKEIWVALDNGVDGSHSPLAPAAVQALEYTGRQQVALNESMWTAADKPTTNALAKYDKSSWVNCTFNSQGPVPEVTATDKAHILVWHGKFAHGLYGSDLPLVRAAGIIDVAPEKLLDLLIDSRRVKEYNSMSQGRTDLNVLQAHMNNGIFGGVTKVFRSKTRPPMLRKDLQLTSLCHARPLPDGSGFVFLTRSVTLLDTEDCHNMVSEILLGVNIIKRVANNPNQTLFVAVNHLKSPMVPMMIAKRIGLQAAANFIHDLRKACAAIS